MKLTVGSTAISYLQASLCLILFLLINCSLLTAQEPSSDESGTLATVALTQDTAFLVIDSGVTSWGKLLADPARKLFDFHQDASCALAGHLSYTPTKVSKPLFVLANTARSWIGNHHETNIAVALPQILQEMSVTYDAELKYTKEHHVKPSRTRGQEITTVLCATYSEGTPKIYQGDIWYGTNGQIRWQEGQLANIFYVAGVIPLDDLVVKSSRQNAFIHHFYPSGSSRIAFERFLQAYSSKDPSSWDETDVRSLLFPLYVQVEDDAAYRKEAHETIGVSAPNNVRVSTKHGEYIPKFEQASWIPDN